MPTKIKPFNASQFTPTQWDTAIAKARFANDLANFVMSGFDPALYTRHLYKHLSLHMFGHIAHYDAGGFYHTWFSTPAQCMEWLRYALSRPIYGDPTYTWSDVERVFQAWLRKVAEQIAEDKLRASMRQLTPGRGE